MTSSIGLEKTVPITAPTDEDGAGPIPTKDTYTPTSRPAANGMSGTAI